MKSRKLSQFAAIVTSICFLFQSHMVIAASVKLQSGTRIYIETTEDLIGKGDQVRQGQSVRAQVWHDVIQNGNVLIAAGTPVIAKVDELKKRQIAGVKGSMSIGAYETESVDGQAIQLSGGYHKDGKSRMALSITLGVLFILPIFIPGKAAELPAGTVFDASIDRNWDIEVAGATSTRKVDLSYLDSDISAELLYEKFEQQEKPKYFEFQITVPQGSSSEFVIDHVNSKAIDPIKLKAISETIEDGELVVNVQCYTLTTFVQILATPISRSRPYTELHPAHTAARPRVEPGI